MTVDSIAAVGEVQLGGQRRLGVSPRLVFGRAADLDHLHAVACFEHAMANGGRLQEAVTFQQEHRLALVFVGHAHPAPIAVDHLETDVVEVHVVGHRSTLGDEDVRGDEPSTETAGDQVAVAHAGTAFAECVVGRVARRCASDDELFPQSRDVKRGIGGHELDDRAVRCGDFAGLADGGEQAQARRRCGSADLDTNGEPEALQHGQARVVGGDDRAYLEPDAGEEVDGGGDRLAARQHDLRRLDGVSAHVAPSLRVRPGRAARGPVRPQTRRPDHRG